MNLRGCVGAAWILALVVVTALWPEPRQAETQERCADGERVQRLEFESPRGAVAVLSCPGDRGHPTRVPAGEAALLMGIPIDLDTASEAELRALPGIGPGLARTIVRDREERGGFGSLDGISRVKGFGPGRVRALRGWATAGGNGDGAGAARTRRGVAGKIGDE